ncbi:MAG: hypothetical protein ACKO66_10065, partial [Flavobacteriales bacterium]
TEGIRVDQQTTSQMMFSVKCNLTESQYFKYRQVLANCGYFAADNLTRVDNTVQVDQLYSSLQFQQEQLQQQRATLDKMSTDSEQFTQMWQSVHNTETAIRNYEREIATLTASEFYYAVDLDIYDETYTPQSSNVTFVNMPGIEYSYYRVEQPRDTVSSPVYQGVFLKYVFTRGKSFASLGAYKSTSNTPASNDSLANVPSAYSEFFTFGFGQDFYSKHLGRGNRKFLNLYTGYTIGGMLMSNDNKNIFSTYVAPSIGLELFKNKYVLIDTKVNYMVPFKETRHVRGLAFNASFNFVF